jgi:hypothetical protein
MTMLDTFETLQATPPVEWDAYFRDHSVTDLDELQRDLDALIERATRMSRYLAYRQLGFSHDAAIKHQNANGFAISGEKRWASNRIGAGNEWKSVVRVLVMTQPAAARYHIILQERVVGFAPTWKDARRQLSEQLRAWRDGRGHTAWKEDKNTYSLRDQYSKHQAGLLYIRPVRIEEPS